jgi:hypothetical protein
LKICATRWPALLLLFVAFSQARAADIVWTNAAGGDWNVAANWSPNSVPGASDTAVITSDGSYTVTLNGPATVSSLALGGTSGTQTLACTLGQTLTLNGASTVNANGIFKLSNGTLTGAGDLTVNGAFEWSGGTMAGTGDTIANGGFVFSGNGAMDLNERRLVNAGAATWTGIGILRFFSSALFTNAPSATFDIGSDANFAQPSGGTFANAGLVRQSAGASASAFVVTFNNSGAVQIQAGTLSLNGQGTCSGTIEVSAGATLRLEGGTFNLDAGSTISGAGNFELGLTGPTANLAGSFALTGTNTFFGGTAHFNGTNASLGSVLIRGGTANFNGDRTIGLALLNLSNGTLGGSNDLVVSGPTTWTGGTMAGAGATIANGGLALSTGANKDLDGRRLVNAGAGTWSDGTLRLFPARCSPIRLPAHSTSALTPPFSISASARLPTPGCSDRLAAPMGVFLASHSTIPARSR